MIRCKPGDLAIIIGVTDEKNSMIIGSIVTVLQFIPNDISITIDGVTWPVETDPKTSREVRWMVESMGSGFMSETESGFKPVNRILVLDKHLWPLRKENDMLSISNTIKTSINKYGGVQ